MGAMRPNTTIKAPRFAGAKEDSHIYPGQSLNSVVASSLQQQHWHAVTAYQLCSTPAARISSDLPTCTAATHVGLQRADSFRPINMASHFSDGLGEVRVGPASQRLLQHLSSCSSSILEKARGITQRVHHIQLALRKPLFSTRQDVSLTYIQHGYARGHVCSSGRDVVRENACRRRATGSQRWRRCSGTCRHKSHMKEWALQETGPPWLREAKSTHTQRTRDTPNQG